MRRDRRPVGVESVEKARIVDIVARLDLLLRVGLVVALLGPGFRRRGLDATFFAVLQNGGPPRRVSEGVGVVFRLLFVCEVVDGRAMVWSAVDRLLLFDRGSPPLFLPDRDGRIEAIAG